MDDDNTDRRRSGRTLTGASLAGLIAGAVGGCVGGAAVLTAVFPSTALWTSRIVCGGPNQLMTNTSHYSYKPGQSGTSIAFQCLGSAGAQDAGFLPISALQTLVVALLLGGGLAIGAVVRRLVRGHSLSPATVLSGGLGLVAAAVAVALLWQGASGSSGPVEMPHGGSLTIDGNGETKAIACNDGSLTINGRDETVAVTGHCARISVDGVIHHITVESADAITVDGLNNAVIYHSGEPAITTSGFQNTVRQG